MEFQLASHTRVGIVGAGRLGRVFAHAALEAGLQVAAVWSRTTAHAHDLAQAVGSRAAVDVTDVVAGSDLVLLCVADQAISGVAGDLALVSADPITFVLGSGAVSIEILAPLARLGHHVVRVHPLQTLTRSSTPRDLMGVLAAITAGDGDDSARRTGTAFARALGMEPFDLADANHTAWHAAATMAANHTVAVLAAAGEVAACAGIAPDVALRAFGGLATAAIERAIEETPEMALTGPVVRGDERAVAQHVDLLRQAAPHLVDQYRVLSMQVARLAASAGRIDSDELWEMRRVLA